VTFPGNTIFYIISQRPQS